MKWEARYNWSNAVPFEQERTIGQTYYNMTIEQLRNTHQASPFRPFTIHLADGRSFLIRHRDYLSHSPSGRTIIVYGDDDIFSILDLLLVIELEVHPTAQQPGEAAA